MHKKSHFQKLSQVICQRACKHSRCASFPSFSVVLAMSLAIPCARCANSPFGLFFFSLFEFGVVAPELKPGCSNKRCRAEYCGAAAEEDAPFRCRIESTMLLNSTVRSRTEVAVG